LVLIVPTVELWIFILFFTTSVTVVGHLIEALEQRAEIYDGDFQRKLTGISTLKQQGMKLHTLSYSGG